jgi:hypothetical protein
VLFDRLRTIRLHWTKAFNFSVLAKPRRFSRWMLASKMKID